MRIRRPINGPLFVAALVAWIAAPAHAPAEPASLASPGDGDLREADMELRVQFRGLVAEVRARQVFVNDGDEDALAVYTFSLPRDAAVTGLEIELPNRAAGEALAVDAEAAVRAVPRAAATEGEPDVGLLRMVGRTDARASYELRVYPVPAGASAEVEVEWASPLELEGGRVSLRIPDRGEDARLGRERVRWRVEPPLGARGLEGAFARGAAIEIARRRAKTIDIAPFSAPVTGDLVLEAVPRLAGDEPQARYGVHELDDGLRAVAGWAYHPRPVTRTPAQAPARILIAADISRSMGSEGVARAAEVADAIAQAAGDAEIQAVVFDRRARRVFGKLRANDDQMRRALRRALAPDSRNNGSDPLAALEEIRPLVERDDPPDLLVTISDGVWPGRVDAAAAKAALGRRALTATTILAVTLVPDGAAAANPDRGPLGALANASGGLAVALRHAEVARRAPELLGQLAVPAPLEAAEFSSRGRRVEPLEMPGLLSAGDGGFAAGFHRGSALESVVLSARRRGQREQASPGRSEVLDRLAFPLAAVRADPSVLLPLAPASSGAPDAQTRALRALHRAALASPVVTPHVSLVVPGADEYGKARTRAVRTWGSWLYRRLPPPPERGADFELRAFESTLATGAPAPSRPTGKLSRSAVRRSLDAAMPRIRHCYRRVLRRDPDLEGSLTLVVELARGEVLAARAEDLAGVPEALGACVAEAAYSVRIPRVALGDEPEELVVARYPLAFWSGGVRAIRLEIPGPAAPAPNGIEIDPDDPLGGMPERR